MSLSREHKNDLKVKAAYYYYKKNMKLADIADTLDVSRVTLNKLLKDAVDEGIVRIEIFDKDNTLELVELQDRVKEKFGLQEAVIVNSMANNEAYALNEIALAAAQFVDKKMFSGIKISLTWGRTLEMMVNYLKGNSRIKRIEVYSMVGAMGILDMKMQPNMIAHSLLQKYQGTGFIMNAPLMCESEEMCKYLMEDSHIASIVERSRESDLTLVGIGPTPNENIEADKRRYDLDVIRELKKNNLCGDIGSNFYDIYGNICRMPLCERFVKVSLDEMKKHKCVVGMAGGEHKVPSILGALNGRHLDVLITDKNTIVSVMEMADMLGI